MELRILGPLELTVAGEPIPLGGPRPRVVLTVLALEANRVVPVDRLVDAVWEEEPPSTAKGQIQICVSGLRRALRRAGVEEVIATHPSGYALRLAEGQLDAEVFDRLTARARSAADAGGAAEAADGLRAALALWRGPALAGLSGRVVGPGATRLEELRLGALEERIRLDLVLGRHDGLVGELRALVAEHPLRERLWAHLMLALYRGGRPADALDAYRAARRLMVRELGLEPGEELRRMERAILSRSAELAPALPAAPAGGRLPERAPVPRQLPSDIADFTGRASLVAAVRRRLGGGGRATGPDAVPVVAIAGPAGVGKSTLAVHAAHALSTDFPDGQLFAKLQQGDRPVEPAELLGRFLQALGVAGTAVPEGADERAELYRSRTADRRILVLLDDAGAEAQVLPLLPGTASCAVIVTGRARLTGLAGAHHLGVDVLDTETAVELLSRVAGAERVAAERAAAARLAGLCGGLPLALRIAGARLASRPHWRVATLNDRLRDETRRLDELQHGDLGIRASISLSYLGQPEPARRLLRRLSLLGAPDFAGWVGAALLDVDPGVAEELLERLADAQLLTASLDPATSVVRYRLHDLVRVFARERAAAEETPAATDAARARALGAWLALAEAAHRHEYGGDYTVLHGAAPRWPLPPPLVARLLARPLAWFDSERAGLVAAVREAAAHGLDELCWDLALTAVTLLETRGGLHDWRDTTEAALAATRRAGNRRGEAAMRYAQGFFHLVRQRYAEARAALAEAGPAFAECADAHGGALVARDLAFLDRVRGQAEHALAGYTDALAGLRAVGDRIGEAHVLLGLAGLLLDAGDHAGGQKLLDEALLICQVAGSRRVEAQVLHRLGELYLERGELDRAAQAFHWVLRIVRDRGDLVGETYGLHGLGRVRHREGHHDRAGTALEQALQLTRQAGDRLVEARVLTSLGELRLDQRRYVEAEALLTAAHGRFGELDSRVWQAKALIALGDGYAAEGRSRDAARTAVCAAALLSAVDSAEARRLRERLTGAPADAAAPGP